MIKLYIKLYYFKKKKEEDFLGIICCFDVILFGEISWLIECFSWVIVL